MNSQNVTDALARALGDPNHSTYSTDDLIAAILRSVAAYSQYFPCLRRMGCGQLVASCKAGEETILCTGGILSGGEVLTLGYGTPKAETVTIAGIAEQETDIAVTQYTRLILESPTTNAHAFGDLLQPATPGLTIAGPIDTYPLPKDFIKVEQSSFDMAVGAKLCYVKQNGFYDATTIISNQLSGTGFGRSMNWGPQSNYQYPLVGNINNNPNAGVSIPGQQVYRFYLSDSPYLRCVPAPQGSAILDFDYYGCQTIASVPSADQELIVLYATWAAASAYAKNLNTAGGGDLKIEDYETKVSANVKALNEIAEKAYAKWEDKVRFTPYATSG